MLIDMDITRYFICAPLGAHKKEKNICPAFFFAINSVSIRMIYCVFIYAYFVKIEVIVVVVYRLNMTILQELHVDLQRDKV